MISDGRGSPQAHGLPSLGWHLSNWCCTALHACHASQAALLLALWAVFLALQLQKSKFGHCTWQFGVTAGAQALLLGLVTFAFVRYQASLAIWAQGLKHPESCATGPVPAHEGSC